MDDMIRYDIFTCAQKLTKIHRYLAHGTKNRKQGNRGYQTSPAVCNPTPYLRGR